MIIILMKKGKSNNNNTNNNNHTSISHSKPNVSSSFAGAARVITMTRGGLRGASCAGRGRLLYPWQQGPLAPSSSSSSSSSSASV